MSEIRWIHKPEFDSFEESKVTSKLEEAGEKLAKIAGKEVELEVHFKQYHKEGSRVENELKLRAHWPGNMVEIDKKSWDASTVTQDAVAALIRVVEEKTR